MNFKQKIIELTIFVCCSINILILKEKLFLGEKEGLEVVYWDFIR